MDSPQNDALIKQLNLVMQSDKPKTYEELGNLLWRAFELGKQYGSGKLPIIPVLEPVTRKCVEVYDNA